MPPRAAMLRPCRDRVLDGAGQQASRKPGQVQRFDAGQCGLWHARLETDQINFWVERHKRNKKDRAGNPARSFNTGSKPFSALTGFETLLRLVDHIDAALAAHDLAIAMTLLERAERVTDLHRSSPIRGARAP
jgi:hypothetical protein